MINNDTGAKVRARSPDAHKTVRKTDAKRTETTRGEHQGEVSK